MLTLHELAWLVAEPALPVLLGRARRDIGRLVSDAPARSVKLLDVGGRKSPYTIGLAAEVTILDLPRKDDVQKALHLGLDDRGRNELCRRRSNIRQIVIEDMTRCTLPSDAYDCATAVEVLEHVKDDEGFLRQVHRVLKPGGWAYFTTPNGDYVRNEPPNYNPDHVRHYTRAQLVQLLCGFFSEVRVVYGVKTGRHRARGLRNLRVTRPIQAVVTMVSNVVNRWESAGLDEQPRRTAHLIATARKESVRADAV